MARKKNEDQASNEVEYIVISRFMDALKSGVYYNIGDNLPDDISEDRIKVMLENNLIKEK